MKTLLTILCSLLILIHSCKPAERKGLNADICIYGGTSAGVIAAYSADLMGKEVILIEPGQRLGGLSSGGLGQTDIGNKYAVTGLSRDFYRRLGSKYGKLEQWKFEPKMALEVYHEILDGSNVKVIYSSRLHSLTKKGTVIESILLEDALSPEEEMFKLKAKVFIDCSYEGDLMAAAGVSYTIGRESNSEYGERYNGVQLLEHHQFPDGVDPYIIPGQPESGLLWGIGDQSLDENGSGDAKVQAYNIRICLTDSLENMIPIERPQDYDSTKYTLFVRLVEKLGSTSIYQHFNWGTMPKRKTDINNHGGFSTDMIGMNWDYPEASYERRQEIFDAHKTYTLGLLYFMGHDSRLPEQMRSEMQRWGLPKDEYTESGNFTSQMYVREARRMIGEYVMTEHNCTGKEIVEDAIGLAAYTMDSHNCQRLVVNGMVKNEGDVQIGGFPPYPISYRSLTPMRDECTNLLVPVDLSATHIAYGSIRMEPVFMVLGQVSGMAASMAIDGKSSVQEIDLPVLQAILKSDPLLDGSGQEIVVDNSFTESLEIEGQWELKNKSWPDKCYIHNYLLSAPGQSLCSASFNLEVEKKGNYKIYYYCPSLFHLENEGAKVGEKMLLTLEAGERSISNEIQFRKNAASWAYFGSYELSPDKRTVLTADASGLDGLYAADAVLLIPEKK